MELSYWSVSNLSYSRLTWPWGLVQPQVDPGHKLTCKPVGVHILWTSPVDSVEGWYEWCQAAAFMSGIQGHQHWQLTLSDAANLLVIDKESDLEPIVQEFPCSCSECIRYQRMKLTLGFPVDFPALAEKYDGIHLTAEGQWRTHLTTPLSLYGWDCETVVLFNIDHVSNPRRLL